MSVLSVRNGKGPTPMCGLNSSHLLNLFVHLQIRVICWKTPANESQGSNCCSNEGRLLHFCSFFCLFLGSLVCLFVRLSVSWFFCLFVCLFVFLSTDHNTSHCQC